MESTRSPPWSCQASAGPVDTLWFLNPGRFTARPRINRTSADDLVFSGVESCCGAGAGRPIDLDGSAAHPQRPCKQANRHRGARSATSGQGARTKATCSRDATATNAVAPESHLQCPPEPHHNILRRRKSETSNVAAASGTGTGERHDSCDDAPKFFRRSLKTSEHVRARRGGRDLAFRHDEPRRHRCQLAFDDELRYHAAAICESETSKMDIHRNVPPATNCSIQSPPTV